MKKMLFWAGVMALAALMVAPVSASAIVYNNDFGGVVSGDNYNEDGFTINFGFSVTDSFVLGSSTTISGANFAVWAANPGDSLTSVDWSIRNNDGADPLSGSLVASGTANPVGTFLVSNGNGYNIYSETFNFSGLALTGGTTYWFQLDSAVTSGGYYTYWDQSDGPSLGYQSDEGYTPYGNSCQGLCTGSESFQLLGGVSSVPEPGTLTLLGCGLLALGAFRRRK